MVKTHWSRAAQEVLDGILDRDQVEEWRVWLVTHGCMDEPALIRSHEVLRFRAEQQRTRIYALEQVAERHGLLCPACGSPERGERRPPAVPCDSPWHDERETE